MRCLHSRIFLSLAVSAIIHRVLGTVSCAILAILNNLQEGDVLFVDEIHRLNRQVEEVLYPAMEDFAIDIMLGKDSSFLSNLPRAPGGT